MRNMRDLNDEEKRTAGVWLRAVAAFLAMLALMVLAALFCGCSTAKYAPERTRTEYVRTDSVMFERILGMMRESERRNQRTSDTTIINVTNTYTLDADGDTISKDTNTREYRSTSREVELEHQVTMLRDSNRMLQARLDSQKADTIRVPVPVERKLGAWERAKMELGGVAMGGLAFVAVFVAGIAAWLAIRRRRR